MSMNKRRQARSINKGGHFQSPLNGSLPSVNYNFIVWLVFC